jgi:dextranase
MIPFSCRIVCGQQPARARILDVATDKARYAPGETVAIEVTLGGDPAAVVQVVQADLRIGFRHLDERVGDDLSRPVTISGGHPQTLTVPWTPPSTDYQGYFVDVRLIAPSGREIDRSQTAVDVSSQWNRFPRYGYLAHYSINDGVKPEEWIAELNKFHIDGLEYYDFQYRHDRPLAGTIDKPAERWFDVAGRPIERSVLTAFLASARRRNMMSMAYNSSYSAYADAFTNHSGVQLEWATWNQPGGPRTLANAKSLDLPASWETSRLIFMNQNCPAWQNYLFGQMDALFRAYPFDGWHIDTFGDRSAYAYDGTYVDFVAGFQPFIDRASQTLGKRIVLNAVGTLGQEDAARSQADFVYSELWDQNETYNSILTAAERVHKANPSAGLVFAAYLHRRDGQHAKLSGTHDFNTSSVLLADAAIFAAGASHIELGDGARMLSSDYFPDDTAYIVSPKLHSALRHYYDFLTAHENILRDEVTAAEASAELTGVKTSTDGSPDAVWTICRQKGDRTVVHLINLLGSSSDRWRDIHADRPDAPLLRNVKVRIVASRNIVSASWATPDVDGGWVHTLRIPRKPASGSHTVDLIVPSLKYWDVIVLKSTSTAATR